MHPIKLEQFEGPLELLLELIQDQKLDITQVSLAAVADQYLEYIHAQPKWDPDELADFLVVAAKLLLIKSKVLLPNLDLGEEGEDALALERQLKLLKQYLEASQKVDALFYVSELLDGWASNLGTKNKYKLIGLLPVSNQLLFDKDDSQSHGDNKKEKLHNDKASIDPHFWTDPLSVKEIVPILVKILAKLDSANAREYQKNGELFVKKLNSLHTDISAMMKPYMGSPVFLFHPSFRYYLRRYGLAYQGSIEVSPGKEPTSRYINTLIKKIRKTGAKAIFTEPQLPSNPAKMIAEAANLNIYTLDPNGGSKGRNNYIDLILYNTRTFQKALK